MRKPILFLSMIFAFLLIPAQYVSAQQDSSGFVQEQIQAGGTISAMALKVTLNANSWRSPDVRVMRPTGGSFLQLSKEQYDTVWPGDIVVFPQSMVRAQRFEVQGVSAEMLCMRVQNADAACAKMVQRINGLASVTDIVAKGALYVPNSWQMRTTQVAQRAPVPEVVQETQPALRSLPTPTLTSTSDPLGHAAKALALFAGIAVMTGGGVVVGRRLVGSGRKKEKPLIAAPPQRTRKRVHGPVHEGPYRRSFVSAPVVGGEIPLAGTEIAEAEAQSAAQPGGGRIKVLTQSDIPDPFARSEDRAASEVEFPINDPRSLDEYLSVLSQISPEEPGEELEEESALVLICTSRDVPRLVLPAR